MGNKQKEIYVVLDYSDTVEERSKIEVDLNKKAALGYRIIDVGYFVEVISSNDDRTKERNPKCRIILEKKY